MYLIEKHLIQPTKVRTMIQAFMDTVEKDMQNLNRNNIMHQDTLEELTYCQIITLYNQLEDVDFLLLGRTHKQYMKKNFKFVELTISYFSFSNNS